MSNYSIDFIFGNIVLNRKDICQEQMFKGRKDLKKFVEELRLYSYNELKTIFIYDDDNIENELLNLINSIEHFIESLDEKIANTSLLIQNIKENEDEEDFNAVKVLGEICNMDERISIPLLRSIYSGNYSFTRDELYKVFYSLNFLECNFVEDILIMFQIFYPETLKINLIKSIDKNDGSISENDQFIDEEIIFDDFIRLKVKNFTKTNETDLELKLLDLVLSNGSFEFYVYLLDRNYKKYKDIDFFTKMCERGGYGCLDIFLFPDFDINMEIPLPFENLEQLKQYDTYLTIAAKNGNFVVVKYLVEENIKLTRPTYDVQIEELEDKMIVDNIKNCEDSIEIFKLCYVKNKITDTLVRSTIKNGDLKLLKYIVETCNFDVNILTDYSTPFSYAGEAVIANDFEILKYLLSKGVKLNPDMDISDENNDGGNGSDSLLDVACMYGSLEMVKFLVNAGEIIDNINCFNSIVSVYIDEYVNNEKLDESAEKLMIDKFEYLINEGTTNDVLAFLLISSRSIDLVKCALENNLVSLKSLKKNLVSLKKNIVFLSKSIIFIKSVESLIEEQIND